MKKSSPKLKCKNNPHVGLTFFFTFLVFCIQIVTLLVSSLILYALIHTGILTIFSKNPPNLGALVAFTIVTSTIIGFLAAAIINRVTLRPYEKMIKQINRLADGDYSARLYFGSVFENLPEAEKLSTSFNKLATELQSSETLRNDFINNFSHEFKTPIVSIAGFAKLIRRGNLSEKQKEEYLAIIEEESLRLADMATNVLKLTKIENQTILTNISKYDLSEQIRACILLLENKWTSKNLELHVDFNEYEISANEELLKQVWINILDNAIKFSHDYGIIEVTIDKTDEALKVCISNSGEKIPDKAINKIFKKFYQADESHSSMGNGIGLAVVKRVVELHNGKITVKSEENTTSFTVILPA